MFVCVCLSLPVCLPGCRSCLPVCCLSVGRPARLSVRMSVYLSVCLSVSMSICLSVACLPACLSSCLAAGLSVCPFFCHKFFYSSPRHFVRQVVAWIAYFNALTLSVFSYFIIFTKFTFANHFIFFITDQPSFQLLQRAKVFVSTELQ